MYACKYREISPAASIIPKLWTSNKAIAEHLAGLGINVVIHGTSPDSPRMLDEGDTLQAAADDLRERYSVKTLPVFGDLTDEVAVKSIVSTIHTDHGPIDFLVNCAGGDIGSVGLTAPMAGKPERNDAIYVSVDDIKAVLDRNLLTCIFCCREVAVEMMERREGRIINIGSTAGCAGRPHAAIYATAKAAVHAYSRCLAAQLREYNVGVNVIAPGPIVTPRFLASREIDDAMLRDGGTFDRYGNTMEVASVVEFLLGEGSSFITAQVIRVDGGLQTWPG